MKLAPGSSTEGSRQLAEKAAVTGRATGRFELTMSELIFKFVDFILGGLLEKHREKKALSEEFDTLRRYIVHENVVRYISLHVGKLRKFLLDTGLVERPQFKAFFDRWLTSPFVGQAAAGAFSDNQIAELKRELSCLDPRTPRPLTGSVRRCWAVTLARAWRFARGFKRKRKG